MYTVLRSHGKLGSSTRPMAVINEILSFLLCHQIYFNFSAMEDQYNFISALSSTRNKFLFTVVLNISGSLTETSR